MQRHVSAIILAILFSILPLAAQPKVSVHLKQVPLREVFSAIEAQTDYSFFYNSNEINASTQVSLDVDDASIQEAVGKVLPGVDCAVGSGRVVLTRRPQAQGDTQVKRGAQLRGVVRDADRQPLPGASVVVVSEGKTYGAITDLDGNFELRMPVAPKPRDPITFSFIGFVDETREVGSASFFDITLQEDNDVLNEVVVVGYGIQRKVDLTGSVSSVKDEDIARRPVMRATTALQGLAAGVTVTQTSGQPGSDGSTIRIHGIGTLNDSDPLVLVDGVYGSLDAINPNDIESISVLKDAASAAIYGSRAANGVILVTTKRGTSDRITATYNGYTGFQRATALPEFASNYDYMVSMNRAYENVGQSPLYTEAYLQDWLRYRAVDPDHYPDIDWQDLLMNGSGFTQNHHASIRGGSQRVQAFASFSYQSQDGIFDHYNTDRYSARANISMEISKHLSASINLDGRRASTQTPTYGKSFALGYINRVPGIYTCILSDGRYGTGFNNRNPLALMMEGGNTNSTTDAFKGSFNLTFKPFKGFAVDFAFTPSLSNTYKKVTKKTVDFYDPDRVEPAASAPAQNSLSQSDSKTTQVTTQIIARYNTKVAKVHDISLMGGYEQFTYDTQSISLSREGFVLPQYEVIDTGSTSALENGGTASAWALLSFFGRMNYAYKDRYLVEANFRADASSRFAKGHRWGRFPSVSLGWRMSEESFMQGIKWLTNLKLRASFGTLGNQSIGTYPAYATITLAPVYSFGNTFTDGGYQASFGNPLISWETSHNWNFGLDASVFDNKLSVSFDYYIKNTDGILLRLPLPGTAGLAVPYQNAGKVRNKGWDLELTYKGHVSDFHYSASFNLSDVHNEVVDLKGAGPIISGYEIIDEGYPIKSLYGYKADGLYRSDEEVLNGPDQSYFKSYGKGDIRYVNITDEDGTTNTINAYDRTVIGNQIPRLTYGLNLCADWKGFDMSLMLQGIGKRDIILTNDCVWALYNAGKMQTWMLDNWTEDNPRASYPRLISGSEHNNFNYSSFWVYNAAFCRLKTLQLGYTLPAGLVEKVSLKNVRFYVTGDNLFTWTGLPKGWDPEMGSGAADIYPLVKTYLFGVQVTF